MRGLVARWLSLTRYRGQLITLRLMPPGRHPTLGYAYRLYKNGRRVRIG